MPIDAILRSKPEAPNGDHLFVVTGCSGGGKSILVDALAARGMATVEHSRRPSSR